MPAPSIISHAAAAANSVNLPSYAVGDIAIVHAFRDGSVTPPSLPGAGWTDIANGFTGSGGTAGSNRVGYRVLQSGDTTTGTWTNATDVYVIVLRGQNVGAPIGSTALSGAADNNPQLPALATFDDQGGTSTVVQMGASRTATDFSTLGPSSLFTQQGDAGNTAMGAQSASGSSAVAGADWGTTINASTTWRAATLEIRGVRTSTITPTELTQGVKTLDSTSATTASITIPNNKQAIAIVSSWAAINPQPTATGWTVVASRNQASGYRLTIFRKDGDGSSGTVTFTASNTQAAWEWWIGYFDGAALGSAGVGTAVLEDCNAVSVNSETLAAVGALQDSNSILLCAISTGVSEAVTPTPRAETEWYEDLTADFGAFEVHTKIEERVARFSWTTATTTETAGAVEIKAITVTNAPAGHAAGTGAASAPSASIAPTAGAGAGTGAASAPSASIAPTAGVAPGVGVAKDPTVSASSSVSAPAGVATATGSAWLAAAKVAPTAGVGAGVGVAYPPTVSAVAVTLAPAGHASGAGSAWLAAARIDVNAGTAAGTGAAHAPTVLTGAVALADAGHASGVGAAHSPSAWIRANAQAATGLGAAHAPTASGVGVTQVPAGHASGSGTAPGPSVAVSPAPGAATGVGTARPPTPGVSVHPGAGSGVGVAYPPAVLAVPVTQAPAGHASGVGAAHSPSAWIRANAQAATGLGAAHAPTASGVATALGGFGAAELEVSGQKAHLEKATPGATIIEDDEPTTEAHLIDVATPGAHLI